MIESIERKYANLLMDYSLYIKKGEKLYINTTVEAEPLVREVYRAALERGAIVEYQMSFSGQNKMLMDLSDEAQINHISTGYENALKNFDAYLVILAPSNLKEDQGVNTEKLKLRKQAIKELLDLYNERTGSGSLKRSLCLYPTLASAQFAGMSMDDYKQFVYKACKLDKEDPVAAWYQLRDDQQHIADRLNQAKRVHYKGSNIDVSFSVDGRTWINSDGRNNMPSGEVFTGPVEDSVNGKVTFSYPSIYMGEEVENVTLWIKDGKVTKWDASKGKDFLDKIFKIKGTRYFGEVAIGTNYDIDRITKNILFDEKIGGTIHMAIGQSYKNTGGKNNSVVHWDMITDMKKDGQIFADDELIYEKGKFLL